MKRFLMVYVSSLVVFLIVDVIWVGYIAGPFYRAELEGIISDNFRMMPALVFYLLFVLGMVQLVVFPSLDRSVPILLGRAALFGLVCYSTYELTNYATIKKWPLSVVAFDLTWGVGISCLISFFGYWLARNVFTA
ncbi:MAG: DUF2177 family protein [bacterium]